MEKQLFEVRGGLQLVDTASFNCYDVKLKVDIGPHKIGKEFFCAFIDYENGIIQLYSEVNELIFEGKLKFKLPIENTSK